jgi:actin-related protein
LPLLISESNLVNSKWRKEILELVFEGELTEKFMLVKQAMLTLYSCGKTNGVVLNSGAYETSLVPLEEGYVLQNHIQSCKFGGESLTSAIK